MSYLTDGDRYILPLALRQNNGFHIACRWYLREFDPLPYQFAYHQVSLPNTTFLAGVAAGKTVSSTASYLIDCLTIPYFRALNTSVTAKQAELAFDKFMEWYEGNPRLEHLVEDIKLRPWPQVKFKNFSEWEFRTAGTDARYIRGSEYDRICFDEAGLDFQGEIVKVLRSRLRGRRPNGLPRMARMDVITSPTDAPWLVERFRRGERGSDIYDPRQYLSIRVRTRDNIRLTPEQIAAMEAEYTDEMRAVEMDAEFPDYGMSMFPKSHVYACTSQALNDLAYLEDSMELRQGFFVEEHPRHGIVRWEMPYDPTHLYIMAGDPGMDDPPRRNAGVIGVLDVTVHPARLVYFHWVSGRGSYNPFLASYRYAMNKYFPQIKMLDTTSTQAGLQELAFTNLGIETDGVNFSRDKDACLNHLSMGISNHEFEWPAIKGLIRQVSSFTRDADRDKNFPQDIVMMLAMLAFGRRYMPDSRDEYPSEAPSEVWRMPRRARTTVARRR